MAAHSNQNLAKRLRLLQLADSGLPIGGLAHSFGLESMVEDRCIAKDDLFPYFADLLRESFLVDAVYCREAHRCSPDGIERLEHLNHQLSARRTARETREASCSLGRRFLNMVMSLVDSPPLERAAECGEMHHSTAFGYACGALTIEEDEAVAAFLHQSVMASISAAQRLLPLGQRESSQIAWELKPAIEAAVLASEIFEFDSVPSFCPLPELASMRHPFLETRLFIS